MLFDRGKIISQADGKETLIYADLDCLNVYRRCRIFRTTERHLQLTQDRFAETTLK
uniref:Uncharacterized protein n=1 Tax=Magallana gigas TaxID=29159 RepID=K1QZX4_MAGGI